MTRSCPDPPTRLEWLIFTAFILMSIFAIGGASYIESELPRPASVAPVVSR